MKYFTKASCLLIGLISLLSFQNCAQSQSGSDTNPTPNGDPETFDSCPQGPITEISKNLNLTGNCAIVGNVNLSGVAKLTMTNGVLSIKGHLILGGDAQVTITRGGLTFPQTDYNQLDVSHLG